MAALSGDYTDCSILIYDAAGNHLCNTVITHYDKNSLRIEVQSLPPNLTVNDFCRVLILSAPTPCEYHGRVNKEGARKSIAMFQGHEKESRAAARFNVTSSAMIENLIFDGHAYPLHTPLEIKLINISQSGVRFKAPNYSLSINDRFQMRMKISGNDKLLIAKVVNHNEYDSHITAYGCQFLVSN